MASDIDRLIREYCPENDYLNPYSPDIYTDDWNDILKAREISDTFKMSKRTCGICGTKFKPVHSRQRYCCRECSDKAYDIAHKRARDKYNDKKRQERLNNER